MKDNFLKEIKNRTISVAVIGLGYIGLPLATLIAKAGFHVTGLDRNAKLLNSISNLEIKTDNLELKTLVQQVVQNDFLRMTSDVEKSIKDSRIIVICVPTPIKENKKPDLSHIENVIEIISRNMSKETLILIKSTLPPRTTNDFIVPFLENRSKLKCGLDFWLCYSPERMSPGQPIKSILETDLILGGYNLESAEISLDFFKTFMQGNIFLTDTTTAEISKVSENTFRDINIAFANELALICELTGSDVKDVIELSNTHPHVNILAPGPGVGGACLPKDPYLLLFHPESKGLCSRVIRASRSINEFMPKHVINLVLKGLHNANKEIGNVNIAVLGTAYKANVNDSRGSPSKDVIEKLTVLGATVTVYDPYCTETFGGKRFDSIQNAIRNADCVVICTDHDEFKKIDLFKIANLMDSPSMIVDGRRIISPDQAEKANIVYYGIGFPQKEN